ncbi:LOW QUALITY PROTEIN: UBX domain-containing protein 1 [Pristis pectinata]|uniref:LOW QUALITY PROTEIN: UBX domain-containing protein 1 n=1 Tax=Pristis pectinata TaxID=685728 RepID=UPI00223CBE0A|nr:LOW QUALITY PROTEIN: UBX domain-containing protein 1 [Pristis pectinata]
MAEMTALESMMEMGFSRNRAEKALALSGNQGIEKAMDWLMEHEDDPNLDEPYVPPQGNVLGTTEKTEIGQAELNFEENSSQIQQNTTLSEEEKKEQLRRLEELMKQRQLEREEREKKEEINREKQRRKQGQELSMIRQKLQEEEMKKIAEDRRKEKLEDIRAQEPRESAEVVWVGTGLASPYPVSAGGVTATESAAQLTPAVPQSSQVPPVKREYDECRLQIRLLDGTQLTQSFKAGEQLAAVRLYVQLQLQEGSENFNLMTSFPRKVFSEEDMERNPLQELGTVFPEGVGAGEAAAGLHYWRDNYIPEDSWFFFETMVLMLYTNPMRAGGTSG